MQGGKVMNKKFIITIGREYGSGGREIGKQLADELKIPFYDKELITMAAQESGFNKELFEKNDELVSYSNNYLAAIGYVLGSPVAGLTDISMNDQLYFIQASVIESLADKGSCVIVGRCADYVLRNHPDVVSIFVHANNQDRILKIVNDYHACSEEEAPNLMEKIDKKRGNYYNYYTNRHWAEAKNYDLSIDSSKLGINKTVEFIRHYLELR